MIGDDNACCPRLKRLQGALDRHDALYDKRLACCLHDFLQLGHRFGTGRRSQVLQERKSCRINIHCDSNRIRIPDQCKFFLQGIDIPGLYGRHAGAAVSLDCPAGLLHNDRIHAVAGHCKDPGLRTGRHDDIIILRLLVAFSVVKLDRTDRTCQDRIFHPVAEEVKGCIRFLIFRNGVHIQADTLPRLEIAYRSISFPFCTRSRDRISACPAVAYRTGPAVRADVFSGIFQ